VRKLLGYRCFEGLVAAKAITRLYGASRLFVNFFQPSFKLAENHRDGAHVSKRYHPPQTPCERLLQAESIPDAAKAKLREVAEAIDSLKLLEEIRAVQAHLMALADGDKPQGLTSEPPNLTAFVASLSSAWRAGEVRPTFSVDAKPRYLRSLQSVVRQETVASAADTQPVPQASPSAASETPPERPQVIYAARRSAKFHALTMVWPLVCRRLEEFPNINCTQLFEELCAQFPGRFSRWQYSRLLRRVTAWRKDARARGVIIDRIKHRRITDKPRGRPRDIFKAHWPEMLQSLEGQPDQTSLELLAEFQARYPERYSLRNLSALQRGVKVWRREAVHG
jgi:hypothetical protein